MCRAKAACFRDRARDSHDPLIGEMLMELAREWEARAEMLERALCPRRPGSPASGAEPRPRTRRRLRLRGSG